MRDRAVSEDRRVLRTGFVGRRREMHSFRRRIKDKKHVTVVQGLGGLGKTTFCFEALKLYSADRAIIPVWLADMGVTDRPAAEMARLITDGVKALLGEAGDEVERRLDQMGIESATDRARAFVRTVLEVPGLPGLVLYLDNLESVMKGPQSDDAEAAGDWRDGAAEVWRVLREVQAASKGRLAVVASCRYRNPDLQPHLLSLGQMTDDALFRLMGWFAGLRRLAAANRGVLADRLAGHPRAVDYLDALVRDRLERWDREHGQRAPARTGDERKREWDEVVEPALPTLAEQIEEDLLLGAIWDRMLGPAARRLLVRLTVLRRPWDRDLMRALAGPNIGDAEAEGAVSALLGASMLTEVREPRNEGGEDLTFEVHPTVAEFAMGRAREASELRHEAYRMAGDFMEKRATGSPDILDDIEAGHYLLKAGERDQAASLLQSASEFLQRRGLLRAGLGLLEHFLKPGGMGAVGDRNRARINSIAARAYISLGDLSKALELMREAVAAGEGLVARDPTNTEWQRDLSVSHNRIGDVLLGRGDLEGALQEYRELLAIGERLAAKDPENSSWQRDMAAGHQKIGDVLALQSDLGGTRKEYRETLTICQRLAAKEPGNAEWQRNLSVSHRKLGDVLRVKGDVLGALREYRRALPIAEQLADQDPTDVVWQRDLGMTHLQVGDVLRAQGDLEGALREYWEDLVITERLAAQDPANVEWQTDLVATRMRFVALIDEEKAEGRKEALRLLRRNLEILVPLQAEGRLRADQAGWIADIEERIARLEARGGGEG